MNRQELIECFEEHYYILSDLLKTKLFEAGLDVCYWKLREMEAHYLHGGIYRYN